MFDVFKTAGDPVLADAKQAAMEYVNELWGLPPVPHPKGRWLSLLGSSGTGKTFLARLILAAWPSTYLHPTCGAQLNRASRLKVWPDIVRKLKSGDGNISHVIDDLIEWPFLVVDEIGASADRSGFVADVLYQVCNGRLGRPTVFTGNITLGQLIEIDTRIGSRMIRGDNEIVEFNTIDWALR